MPTRTTTRLGSAAVALAVIGPFAAAVLSGPVSAVEPKKRMATRPLGQSHKSDALRPATGTTSGVPRSGGRKTVVQKGSAPADASTERPAALLNPPAETGVPAASEPPPSPVLPAGAHKPAVTLIVDPVTGEVKRV